MGPRPGRRVSMLRAFGSSVTATRGRDRKASVIVDREAGDLKDATRVRRSRTQTRAESLTGVNAVMVLVPHARGVAGAP